MISSVDGRAAIDGRSVALGHPDDRALLRELRTAADAVLVGRKTVEAERYARLLDEGQVAYRRELGLSDHPLVAIASRSGEVDRSVPLFSEEGVPVEILAGLELPDAVTRLRSVHGARAIACEGGPTLLGELIGAGLVDDLLVTVAPLVAGGDAPRIVEGSALADPAHFAVRAVHRADDHVFLHYVAT